MLIQKLRLQRGWSQEQLAEMSGLSVRTIQRLERGGNVSVESLKALGAVFDVDFSALKPVEKDRNMNPNANSGQLRADEALALAKVQESKRFYIHLAQYLTTVAVLAAINVFLTPRAIWAPFVAVGWGLSVIFHGLRVFDRIPVFTPAWEKRRVEALLGRKL